MVVRIGPNAILNITHQTELAVPDILLDSRELVEGK